MGNVSCNSFWLVPHPCVQPVFQTSRNPSSSLTYRCSEAAADPGACSQGAAAVGFIGRNHMWDCTCWLFSFPSSLICNCCSHPSPPPPVIVGSLPPPAKEMRGEVIFANAAPQIGHEHTVSSAGTFSMGNHRLLGFLKLCPSGSATCFWSSGPWLSLLSAPPSPHFLVTQSEGRSWDWSTPRFSPVL